MTGYDDALHYALTALPRVPDGPLASFGYRVRPAPPEWCERRPVHPLSHHYSPPGPTIGVDPARPDLAALIVPDDRVPPGMIILRDELARFDLANRIELDRRIREAMEAAPAASWPPDFSTEPVDVWAELRAAHDRLTVDDLYALRDRYRDVPSWRNYGDNEPDSTEPEPPGR